MYSTRVSDLFTVVIVLFRCLVWCSVCDLFRCVVRTMFLKANYVYVICVLVHNGNL